MFHKKGDVDRLYPKRAEGGRRRRGLISLEDCVLIEKNCLHVYVSGSKEKMLKVVKNEGTVEIEKTKKDILDSRRENLKRKNQHSVFFKNTEFRDEQTWNWLKKGDFKKATEGTIMAAQEQAIRTRSIRHCIDKENISPLCRLCGGRDETVARETEGLIIAAQDRSLATRSYHNKIIKDGTDPNCRTCNEFEETIDHIVAGCPVLAKMEYIQRHDSRVPPLENMQALPFSCCRQVV